MAAANELIKAITIASKSEQRSKQKAIGPSEIGGCRRRTWLRLNDAEITNMDTFRFPAMFGTAIHSYILDAFKKLDPFEERFILEAEFESKDDSLIGHVDMYDKEKKEIVDWKSMKKAGLRYFPSQQQRWQVQLYGYLVQKNGYEVENVTLVGIPRDGTEADVVFHTEPYDPAVVTEALNWVTQVKLTQVIPPAEKDVSFCAGYCPYYDASGKVGCTARPKAEAEGAIIEDTVVQNVAKRYLEITKEIGALEDEKDAIKGVLEGVNGITQDGLKVAWSAVAGRKSIDEDAVKQALGHVPYKVGNPSYRLAVKNVGA
jgi:hypothetical protein